jgi:hypothetical protein
VGAEHNMYKCGGCNILNTNLRYRVYPAGSPSGVYLSDNIFFTSDFTNGCSGADQLWSNNAGNVNILSGLAPGNYVLEVFSEIATTCSGTLFANNSGANYKATFTVTPTVLVTATIGNVGPTGYLNLSSAFAAINTGVHKGIIGINIIENFTETSSALLFYSGYISSSYTSITINPTGARTITGNIVGALIDLNGADNVTIDGLNSSGNSLRISNSSNGNSSTLQFRGDASNNIITKCQILGSSIPSSSTLIGTGAGTIHLASGIITGNDNNTILNCDIGDATGGTPIYGILSNSANASLFNDNLQINNCNIYNYFSAIKDHAGILLNRGGVGISITGNSFYQTISRNITTASVQHNFIFTVGNVSNLTSPAIGGVTINDNYFGGTAANCGGTALTITGSGIIRGLYLNLLSTTPSSIQNNTFQNINFTTSGTSAANSFIDLVNGAINAGTTTGNTFGNMTGNGNISITLIANNNPPAQFALINLFTGTTGAAASEVSNNNFGSINFAKGVTTLSNRVPVFKLINTKKAAYPSIKIANNNIGSTATLNSIASSSASKFSLINLEGSTTSTSTEISGNNIYNCSNISTDSTASISCISVGSTTSSPINISNNNIYYIKNNGEYLGVLSATSDISTIGIELYNSSAANITSNTIKYFSNTGVGTSSAKISTVGILNNSNSSSTISSTISSNIVSDFTSSSNYNSYIGTSPSLAGIATASPLGNQVISDNKVFNLELKSTVGNTFLSGLLIITNLTGPNCKIYNNRVYGLKNLMDNQSAARVVGLNVNAGGTTLANAPSYYNNTISLNNDNGTNDIQLAGIRDYSSTTTNFNNYYFNSVNFYGTGSSPNRTFAFFRDQKSVPSTKSTILLQNNIFQNIRKSTIVGFNINLAIGIYSNGTDAATLGLSSDFNNIYATNSNGYVGEIGNIYTNFANWKTLTGGDATSVSDTVTFVDIEKGDLHLLSNNCVIDGAALPIAGITTDYDGTTRNTTLPDIGAIETTAIPPTATITPNTSLCSGTPTVISIDMTGIPKWSLKYNINGGSPISVNYLTSSPYTFTVAPTVTTNYNITNLKSGSCYVTSFATPTATVTMKPVYTWFGINTNWFDAVNWCPGVPTSTSDVTIPSGAAFYPTISSGDAYARSVTIAANASIVVNGTGKFNWYGNISNAGNFDMSDGTLNAAGPLAQTISGALLAKKTIKNLIISNTFSTNPVVSLANIANDTLKITGFLSFGNINNKRFETNGNLTLISNSITTARVKDITNNTTNIGNSITGNVNVERYISNTRKWQFIAINTNGAAQTIQNAWMEKQLSGTTGVSNYGTWVTDATGAVAGFDGTSYTPSMKWYNGLDYTGITNPNTFNIKSKATYFVYVRGDRNAKPNNVLNAPTVLRTYGGLMQGTTASIPVASGVVYVPVGNAYASAVDLTKLTYTKTDPITISVWDSKLVGLYGIGGFQYLTATAPGNDFKIMPGGGSYGPLGTVTNIVESGQAFFIQGAASARAINFVEIAKTPKALDVFFTQGKEQEMSVSLFLKDQNSTTLVDATLLKLKDENSIYTEADDARKMTNTSENLSIKRGNELLAINYKNIPTENDTIQLNLTGVRIKDYQFKVDMTNMDMIGRQAFLLDNYLNTTTVLDLTKENTINFSIINNASSYAANRFKIVFKQKALPKFVSFIAKTNSDKVNELNWKVINENFVETYEVERSKDGEKFEKIEVVSKFITPNGYAYNDEKPVVSFANYYRIKMKLLDGTFYYSKIIKLEKITEDIHISVVQNPVINKVIALQFSNKTKGTYNVQLVNTLGQIVYTNVTKVESYFDYKNIYLDNAVLPGIYELVIWNNDNKKEVFKIVVQ